MPAMPRALATIVAVVVLAACGEKSAPQQQRPVATVPTSAAAPDAKAGAPGEPAARPVPAPEQDTKDEAPRDNDRKPEVLVAAAESKRRWIRENTTFRDSELTWAFADPYVIFQEVRHQDIRDTRRTGKKDQDGREIEEPLDGTADPAKLRQNEAWAHKGELFARRESILLVELNRRFRELFAERCALPTLEAKGRVLTCVVTWNRESFDSRLGRIGLAVGPFTRAFYSPAEHRVFSYVGDESMRNLDELPCAGGRVQKESDQVLLYVGTHQLVHEYAAIAQGHPLADGDSRVPTPAAMWFDKGFAEFMSGVEVGAAESESLQGATWSHNRVILSRVSEARESRKLAESWTLAKLMKPDDEAGVRAAATRSGTADSAMSSLYSCRAWAFCHFLWNYDAGRYRERFLAFLDLVLHGTQSSDRFATEIMHRPSRADWGPVEMEYEWYWAQLLARRTGRDALTGQWRTPSTDAPTGRVEDDPDFVEAWNEDHRTKR